MRINKFKKLDTESKLDEIYTVLNMKTDEDSFKDIHDCAMQYVEHLEDSGKLNANIDVKDMISICSLNSLRKYYENPDIRAYADVSIGQVRKEVIAQCHYYLEDVME